MMTIKHNTTIQGVGKRLALLNKKMHTHFRHQEPMQFIYCVSLTAITDLKYVP